MRRSWAALLGATALLASVGPSVVEGNKDYLIPLDRYTTPKGRALATSHKGQLLGLYEHVYHCLPWVGVAKNGIGFARRKGAEADDRYLSLWIDVDQTDDGTFAALTRDRRASAMLSRYGIDMLRRMTALTGLRSDPDLFGYSVILAWLKPGGGQSPSKETLAIFADKASVEEYLGKRLPGTEFVKRSTFVLFDGKEEMPRPQLEVWEDSFNSTYKLKNYELQKDQKC